MDGEVNGVTNKYFQVKLIIYFCSISNRPMKNYKVNYSLTLVMFRFGATGMSWTLHILEGSAGVGAAREK